jgi:hypothetical protein
VARTQVSGWATRARQQAWRADVEARLKAIKQSLTAARLAKLN